MSNANNKVIDRNLTIIKEASELNLMFSKALNKEYDSDFFALQNIITNGIDNILDELQLPTDDNTTNAFYTHMQVFDNPSLFLSRSNLFLENRAYKFKDKYSKYQFTHEDPEQ